MNASTATTDYPRLLLESLRLLEGHGMIIDLARELSAWLRDEGIDGRVVGGIAVVLHGYARTTLDIDVHTSQPEPLGELLRRHGAVFNDDRREFSRDGIPIHIVLPGQSGPLQHPDCEINGIRTVDLGDLVTLKLRSGTKSVRRAKDLADVVELIQRRSLTKSFASRLGKDQRAAFRRLVASIEAEGES